MLNAAVNADLIARSPARNIALPRVVHPERSGLSPSELAALVTEVPEHYQALVLVGAVLGLRWGEAVGLRVRDVDFMRHTVTIAQTVEELSGRMRVVPVVCASFQRRRRDPVCGRSLFRCSSWTNSLVTCSSTDKT